MKSYSRETIFLSLSAFLVLLLGITYLTQGSRHHLPKPKQQIRVTNSSSSTSSSSKPVDQKLKDFVKQLEDSEKKPTADGLKALKERYKELSDSPEKKALEARLTNLEQVIIAQDKAQEALLLAENTGLLADITKAQELVDKLADSSLKTDFQNRLAALTAPSEVASTTSTTAQISQPIVEPEQNVSVYQPPVYQPQPSVIEPVVTAADQTLPEATTPAPATATTTTETAN